MSFSSVLVFFEQIRANDKKGCEPLQTVSHSLVFEQIRAADKNGWTSLQDASHSLVFASVDLGFRVLFIEQGSYIRLNKCVGTDQYHCGICWHVTHCFFHFGLNNSVGTNQYRCGDCQHVVHSGAFLHGGVLDDIPCTAPSTPKNSKKTHSRSMTVVHSLGPTCCSDNYVTSHSFEQKGLYLVFIFTFF